MKDMKDTPFLIVERHRGDKIRRRRLEIIETVEANSAREVEEALRRIDRSRRKFRSGHADTPWESGWIGFVSYDAGFPFLGIARTTPRTKRRVLPLLRFHRIGQSVVGLPVTAGVPQSRLTHRSDTAAGYAKKIRAVQRELNAGNAYEVNISQRWEWEFARRPDAAALFSRLCENFRPAFGFLESLRGSAYMGFSPELFFSVHGRMIVAEPIKGTGERSKALIGSAKNRAELLMITDLFRNDFGRICVPGSIRAGAPAELDLPYLKHLYSRISGRLAGGTGLYEIFSAIFPSGSVTGAPKISACSIIDRMEPFEREEAFGAYGWLGCDRMEFAVSIRTGLLRGRKFRYTAGGGITVYSNPGKEYKESILKAKPVFEEFSA